MNTFPSMHFRFPGHRSAENGSQCKFPLYNPVGGIWTGASAATVAQVVGQVAAVSIQTLELS